MSRSARLSFLVLCLLLVAPLALAAGEARPPATWQALDSSPAGAEARLAAVQRSGDSVSLSLSLPGFWARTVDSKAGPRGLLEIPEGGVTANPGSPLLPVLRYMVEAPPGAKITLDLTASWQRSSLADLGIEHRLLPVQHPVPKIEGAAALIPFVEDAAIYETNAFMPAEAAVVADRAVIRGRHIALIEIRPVRYNPATGSIQYWSQAELRISFDGGIPEAARRNKSRLASAIHDSWLAGEIIELPSAGDESSTRGPAGGAAEGAVGMLVICHDDFEAAVTPLLDWKEKSGFKVEVVLISEIGARRRRQGGDPAALR